MDFLGSNLFTVNSDVTYVEDCIREIECMASVFNEAPSTNPFLIIKVYNYINY